MPPVCTVVRDLDVWIGVLLQTDLILESRLSGVASLVGLFPFGQFLATPFILVRIFTLPWAPNAYATSSMIPYGNTGHATANTGNLLSVLTLYIIQVVM
jgi:hypothetical protein